MHGPLVSMLDASAVLLSAYLVLLRSMSTELLSIALLAAASPLLHAAPCVVEFRPHFTCPHRYRQGGGVVCGLRIHVCSLALSLSALPSVVGA